jgi:lysophospholipase L1-like esterase
VSLPRLAPLAAPLACALTLVAAACGSRHTGPTTVTDQGRVPRLLRTSYLAFGDSLTEGLATPLGPSTFSTHPEDSPGDERGYPYKLQELLNARYATQTIHVYNGGFGGQNASADAAGITRSLGEFLDAFHPQVMILMHGANDINAPGATVGPVVAAVESLVVAAQAAGADVIVSGLPPRTPGGTPSRGNNPELVVPYNTALSTMAAAHGARFVDIYPLFSPSLAGPDLAPDGLHLTQSANLKLAQAYFKVIAAAYEVR